MMRIDGGNIQFFDIIWHRFFNMNGKYNSMHSFLDNYHKVDVNKSSSIIFPDLCVACSQKCKDEQTNMFGSFGEVSGHWTRIIKGRPKISVPAHNRCKQILKKKFLRREIIGLALYGIPTGIYLYFHRELDIWLALFVAFSVFLSGIILNRLYYQMPVEFTVYNDKLSFMFKDKEYVYNFTHLNENALYEKRILKSFGQNESCKR